MSREDDSDEGGGRPGLPIDVRRIVLALLRGWKFVVAIGVVGAFVGATYAKLKVPVQYVAESALRWESEADDILELQTSLDAVKLSVNLQEVNKRLKMGVPLPVLKMLIDIDEDARNSNQIVIRAISPKAKGASDLCNTVVDVFLDHRRKLSKARHEGTLTRLRAELDETEQELQDGHAAFDAFREEYGVADLTAETQLAIRAAATARAAVDSARAEAAGAEAALQGVGKSAPAGGGSKPVAGGPSRGEVEADRQRLITVRGQLARARLQYAEEHPNVRRLEAEIAALQDRTAAYQQGSRQRASRQRGASLARTRQAALRKRASQERLAAQAEERLKKLSAVEGKAALLLADVTAAEDKIDRTRRRIAEVEEDEGATNFRILTRATPPASPTSSKRKKVAMGTPAAFAIVAILLVLAKEFWGGRLITPTEIAYWANLPVVGATTWPREKDRFAGVMRDLEEFAPLAGGVTLIVGLTGKEMSLASEVGAWNGQAPTQGEATGAALARTSTALGQPNFNRRTLAVTGDVEPTELRRAARLADRVLVVVGSALHGVPALTNLRTRLGRDDEGMAILVVGLGEDYALVRDRVGDAMTFWSARRAVDPNSMGPDSGPPV